MFLRPLDTLSRVLGIVCDSAKSAPNTALLLPFDNLSDMGMPNGFVVTK